LPICGAPGASFRYREVCVDFPCQPHPSLCHEFPRSKAKAGCSSYELSARDGASAMLSDVWEQPHISSSPNHRSTSEPLPIGSCDTCLPITAERLVRNRCI